MTTIFIDSQEWQVYNCKPNVDPHCHTQILTNTRSFPTFITMEATKLQSDPLPCPPKLNGAKAPPTTTLLSPTLESYSSCCFCWCKKTIKMQAWLP